MHLEESFELFLSFSKVSSVRMFAFFRNKESSRRFSSSFKKDKERRYKHRSPILFVLHKTYTVSCLFSCCQAIDVNQPPDIKQIKYSAFQITTVNLLHLKSLQRTLLVTRIDIKICIFLNPRYMVVTCLKSC